MASAAACTSCSVAVRSRESLSVPMHWSAGMPMAVSTALGAPPALWQAAPADTLTPLSARASLRAAECRPGQARESVLGRQGSEGARVCSGGGAPRAAQWLWMAPASCAVRACAAAAPPAASQCCAWAAAAPRATA